jgi:outer membrane receptor protein involved in Fe transport
MARTSLLVAVFATLPSARAEAAAEPAATLPQRVEIVGSYQNALGTSDAASEGVVGAALIERRPTLRPAELLEFVPGVIVTQHSGDGKANQYFLRGFNLDHGTDFATTVDGMPVNMPSHAHGQGYSDLNWLIPELVGRIAYRKGPYFADEGDFSSAGAAHLSLFDALPATLAKVTAGDNGYARALLGGTQAVAGGQLTAAVEGAHNDGPWDLPEAFHRANGLLRWTFSNGGDKVSVTGMGYSAAWRSTDQIPLRAVASGLIGRFGTVDPTDGGRTSRASLSMQGEHVDAAGGTWRANAYAVRSRLDLFSDFTFFLDHPTTGDQFEQAESRRVLGLGASRRWPGAIAGLDTTWTVGTQWRQDHVDPVGLYETVARVRTATVQQSVVSETAASLYGEAATQWSERVRGTMGARVDHVDFDVSSSIAANGGRRGATIASPKLALVFGPWAKTEFFVDAGAGFHSNDARGTTETVTPKDGLPAQPVTPLVRTRGEELGLRTVPAPGLQVSMALWRLEIGSELVFSGDAGDTSPSRPSERHGVELDGHWAVTPHWALDGDVSVSRARYTTADAAGSSIPGSIATVATFGAAWHDGGPWFGQFQLRYFGPRPLIEDASVHSKSTTLASLRGGYRFTPHTSLTLDVFNLFDRMASDIDYDYTSRLPGEGAQGVDGVHFHPVEPRSLRLTLATSF